VTEYPSNQLPQFTILGRTIQPNYLGSKGALTAEAWIESASKAVGAYIHIPFCFHKCHYCDFYSVAGKDEQQETLVRRLRKELQCVGPSMSELKTVFIGGGTPTILEPALLCEMLEAVRRYLPLAEDVEFTIEANPETITAEKAGILASCGVNRVSVGAQSFDENLLKQLERWHEPKNVERAVDFARSAGISNINIDLIYAIPTQSIVQAKNDLLQAVALSPTHLSCYALTYELNTPLRHRLERGIVERIAHDVEAEMFDVVTRELTQEGFCQYEISNFANKGYACKHNVMYWKNKNWWPFGPAAAGHIDGCRWRNAPRISEYLLEGNLPPIQDVETLSEDVQAGEAFMMGLRLLEGMESGWVEELMRKSPGEWRRATIERNIETGMLVWEKEKLALTGKGLHFADTVISELLMRDEDQQD
jgi:oxygen-independent coproporphyrinogen III oxidase